MVVQDRTRSISIECLRHPRHFLELPSEIRTVIPISQMTELRHSSLRYLLKQPGPTKLEFKPRLPGSEGPCCTENTEPSVWHKISASYSRNPYFYCIYLRKTNLALRTGELSNEQSMQGHAERRFAGEKDHVSRTVLSLAEMDFLKQKNVPKYFRPLGP